MLLSGLGQNAQAASGNSEPAATKEQVKALQAEADDAKTKAANAESQANAANETPRATQRDIQNLGRTWKTSNGSGSGRLTPHFQPAP